MTFRQRAAAVWCAAALLAPRFIAAQQVRRGISRNLARALARPDSAALIWLFAERGADPDSLAAALRERGVTVRRVSHFLGAVSATTTGRQIRALGDLRGVRRVQPVLTFYRRPVSITGPLRPVMPSLSQAPIADTTYGPGAWAFRLLNIPAVHALGVRGAGVKIAMLDTGFNTDQPLMALAHLIGQFDFVYNDSIVKDEPGETPGEMAHGTGTWSLLAAQQPGRLFGAAPDADYLLAKTEYTPTETRVEEDNWVAGMEWAIAHGAQIVSSSLGYLSFDNGFSYAPLQLNGDVAVTSVEADSAAARGVLVVVAVGNLGSDASGRYIAASEDTPADADSIVSVGATDSLGREAGFSSHGPTADGRTKPEVSGPGVTVTIARIDTGITIGSGTSFATPLVAGIAALAQSVRGSLPAVELRRGILMAASHQLMPDDTSGWGIPDALKLYAFPTGVVLSAPAPGLLTTATPYLVWDAGVSPPGTTPNTYRLRLFLDAALTRPLLDTTLAASRFQMPFGVHGGSQLFWRVIATSSLGVSESTAVGGPATLPPWATLLTLASPQGSTIADSSPRFYWHSPQAAAPPGPFSYDVDVYPASRTPAFAVASARGITDTTFQPTTPLEKNEPFRWRVVAHLGADSEIITSPGTFLVADQSAPSTTLLFQNFPNPFPNPAVGLATTCFWFDIATSGQVRLEIFDLRGRMVKRLAPTATISALFLAGRYGRPATNAAGTCDSRFAWDGRDEQGNYVRAGVYVYRLSAPGFTDVRRLVFLGPP